MTVVEPIVEPGVEPIIEQCTEPIEGAVVGNDIVAEAEVGAASVITHVRAVANTVVVEDKMAVEPDSNVTENSLSSRENDEVKGAGKIMKLPDNKTDYIRMSVGEKVRCYPFDDKGTDAAFEMVRAYFEKIGMDTSFHSVYEEAKLLTDYYEKQKD